MRIVFFGTSAFSANILKFLAEIKQNVVAVVTRPARLQGRSLKLKSPLVKDMCQVCFPDIPIYQPEKASTDSFCEEMMRFDSDLFMVVAYGEIIKNNLLSVPKKACINIHASLLPKYRGAAPLQRCLLDGEKESGITIMDMVLKMDAGDILIQERVEIPEEMNCGELEEKLLNASYKVLPKLLSDFDSYYSKKKQQVESKVTFASKISTEDTEIRWSKRAVEIHNQIRAFSPFPGAWCKVKIGEDEKRFKILVASYDPKRCLSPATWRFEEGSYFVGCKEGVISLIDVQLEGKRPMPASEFFRGFNRSFVFLLD